MKKFKWSVLPVFLMAALLLVGCEDDTAFEDDILTDEEPYFDQSDDFDAETDEQSYDYDEDADDDPIDEFDFQQEKESFISLGQMQIDDLEQSLESLTEVAENRDIQAEFAAHRDAITQKLQEAKMLLEQVEQASRETWPEKHEQFHETMDRLIELYQQASEEVRSHMQPDLEELDL